VGALTFTPTPTLIAFASTLPTLSRGRDKSALLYVRSPCQEKVPA
jgi:hypothetical protein